MKNNYEKNKFIELRAKGLSFDKISAELGISKPTLLQWNTEFSSPPKEGADEVCADRGSIFEINENE